MRPFGDLPGDDPERDAKHAAEEDRQRAEERRETAAALEAAGIELDPTPPGTHRHGDLVHPSDHAHPHVHAEAGQPPVTGSSARGPWGQRLAWRCPGPAGRSTPSPAATLAGASASGRMVTVERVFLDAQALVEEVELIIVAVPDDALVPLARTIRMYGGQAMIHTSGALGAEVLEPAQAAGTQVGSFHPLVAFADIERAVAALHGATVAIEGDDQLLALLAEMAERIGARAVRLAPGSKPAYHAAAVLAAGGFVALLDAIAELGRVAGLDEAGALAVYGPLIEGTLGNARALGIRAALTGPITRGDDGTLRAHLATLEAHAPGVPAVPRRGRTRDQTCRGAWRADTGRRCAPCASLASVE